jgi:eukaryotic-like serine/threonine-protein kinase
VIGETFAGKYTITRLLGQGGMGAVYEARHARTGRRVAIKIIAAEHASDPKLLKRFEIEARATSEIESQHIAHVLDVGVEQGTPFLVMEFLAGEDLGRVLEKLGPQDRSHVPPAVDGRVRGHGLDRASRWRAPRRSALPCLRR